jgi:multiple sugar transport system permease protein
MAQAEATRAQPTATADVGPVGDRGRRWRRGLAYFFLIGYALLMFVPFIWMVTTSFKTQPDSVQMTWIPDPISLEGWERALNELNPNIVKLFLNSALLAGAVTLSNVALGAMAGYAFARLRFRGREILFILVLATMMIPDQLRMVPVYQMMRQVGLISAGPTQFIGITLVMGIAAVSVFLMRQYFLSIPRDLEEAAKIDGAGFFTTFLRVMLPLATPAIAAVAILQFQGAWNSFFWPLILLSDRQNWTLPLGLTVFQDQFTTYWPSLMAVSLLATIPILILFIFFQRYFVEGIAAAGVKG